MTNRPPHGASLIGLVSASPRLTRAVSLTLAREHEFAVLAVEDIVRDSIEATTLLDDHQLRDIVDLYGWDDALASGSRGTHLRLILNTYRRSRPATEWADMLTAHIYDMGGPGLNAPLVITDADEPAVAERLRDLGGAMWGLAVTGQDTDITLSRPRDLTELSGEINRALTWTSLARRRSLASA